MTMDIGLVGCGLWGSNVLRDLRSLGCRVYVADPAPAHRADALQQGAAEAVAEVDSLPAVTGVVVASPASTHAEVVEQLLPRSCPLFVEKPFTTDVTAARRLCRLGGERLFLMHVWRYHPGIEALARIAAERELGEPVGLRTFRTNWTSPRRDVDSVWTLVPHDLTIALAILGEVPPARFALAEQVNQRVVSMLGVLGEAPWLVFEASNRYGDKRREVRLHCQQGVAVLPDPSSPRLEIVRNSAEPRPAIERRVVPDEPALKRELTDFIEHLRGGPRPRCSAEEGLLIVERIAELRELAGV